MFGLFKRRKRTLVEKIVDRARATIVKQRDYHRREFDLYTSAAQQALDRMHHHKAIYLALNEKIASLDNPQREPRTAERQLFDAGVMPAPGDIVTYDTFDGDDFGLGEELAEDDAAILADMGDGRTATVSDTLAKIEAAAAERAAEPNEDFGDLPDNEPQQVIIPELKYEAPPVMPVVDEVLAEKKAKRPRRRGKHDGLPIPAPGI